MASVLCIGIAVLDSVFAVDAIPSRAEKVRARDLKVVGGGIAANAAVAVARLGGRAALATRLGDDLTGDAILRGLEEEGVDCGLARRFPGRRSPTAAILVDPQGERLVAAYVDLSVPDDPGWLPDAFPEGTDAVLGDTRWEQGARRLFALARAAGRPAVLDGDRRPEDPELPALATHAAFSEQGLLELTGSSDPAEALASLRASAPDTWLAVTLGERGVLFLERGEVVHEPAPRVAAVDTLGAGDVWHGALALALAEGMPERPAVRFAHAVAALKCTRFGGRAGTPGRAEVESFLRGVG